MNFSRPTRSFSVVFIAGVLVAAVSPGNLSCRGRGGSSAPEGTSVPGTSTSVGASVPSGASTPEGGAVLVITGDTLYENKTGKSGTVSLPDGSRVVLGAHTSIHLSKVFDQAQRELDLDGEALFDIVPDAGKPFIVHTRLLLIEVLGAGSGGNGMGGSGAGGGSGTRFRVDAHRENAGEEADLLKGRLRARKSYHSDTDNEAELLDTGEMVMINKDIDLMEKEKLDSTDWKRLRGMQ
jgi:ferric-dicitrate binding protein FerR (iron transport regulator)